MRLIFIGALVSILSGCASLRAVEAPVAFTPGDAHVWLGDYSVGLAVKHVGPSRAFLLKLGLRTLGADPARRWLLLHEETRTLLSLQRTFEENGRKTSSGDDRAGRTWPLLEDVDPRTSWSLGLALVPTSDESAPAPARLVMLVPDLNPVR